MDDFHGKGDEKPYSVQEPCGAGGPMATAGLHVLSTLTHDDY